ncbi:MAG: hypothetical protein ACPLPR_10000 [Bacillota bacterium]
MTRGKHNDWRLERLQEVMSTKALRATVFAWNREQRWIQHPVEFKGTVHGGKLIIETGYIPEGGWQPGGTYVAVLDLSPKSSSFDTDCDMVTEVMSNKVRLALRGEVELPPKPKGSLKELRVGDIVRLDGPEIVSRHYQSRRVFSTWFSVGPDENAPARLEVTSSLPTDHGKLEAIVGQPVDLLVRTWNAYGEPVDSAVTCEVVERGSRAPMSAKLEGPTSISIGASKFTLVNSEAEEVEAEFAVRVVGTSHLQASVLVSFAPASPAQVTVAADPMQLTPGQQCVLYGNVTDRFGNPVSGAQLNVSVAGTASGLLGNGTATTDESGEWRYVFASNQAEFLSARVSMETGAAVCPGIIRCVEESNHDGWSADFVIPSKPFLELPIGYADGKLSGLPGTAPAGWWVKAQLGDEVLGITQALPDGSWTLAPRPLEAGQRVTLVFTQAQPEMEPQPQPEPQPTVLTFEGTFGWGQTYDNGIRYLEVPHECDVVFEYYSTEQINTAYHNQNLYFLVYPPGSTTPKQYRPAGKYTVHLLPGSYKLVLSTSLGISRARMVVTIPPM